MMSFLSKDLIKVNSCGLYKAHKLINCVHQNAVNIPGMMIKYSGNDVIIVNGYLSIIVIDLSTRHYNKGLTT